MSKNSAVRRAIRLLASSWRIRVPQALPNSPAVLVFWHDEMLPIWKTFGGRGAVALTSRSGDGELLAGLLQDWDFTVLRGSSSSGGKEALAEMERAAREQLVLLTPDGSRGPRHVMKAGAVVAAARAGVPIYCARIRASGHRLERSWDKFLIPWPFASIEIVISDAIHPPDPLDRQAVDNTIRLVQARLQDMELI